MRLVRDEEHHEIVIGAVRRAKKSVWIATANVKEMLVQPAGATRRGARWVSVLGVLDDLARRRVALRLLHAAMPSRPFRDAFDRYERLTAGGLQLRQCPRVHLKTVIVDGASMYIGSANWTGAGLGAKSPHRRNFELGVHTTDKAMIADVSAQYDRIWRGAACSGCGVRATCEAPLDLPDARSTGRTIVRTLVRIGGPASRPAGGARI